MIAVFLVAPEGSQGEAVASDQIRIVVQEDQDLLGVGKITLILLTRAPSSTGSAP